MRDGVLLPSSTKSRYEASLNTVDSNLTFTQVVVVNIPMMLGG